MSLIRYLRSFQSRLDYFAVRTDEGNGVYHLVLISSAFIPIKRIQDFWGSYCWINLEHDIDGLILEMVLQRDASRYSMSRGFLPAGACKAIEAISSHFRGNLGVIAQKQLARRWKHGDAYYRTCECCGRKLGWYSDIRTRHEYYGGIWR